MYNKLKDKYSVSNVVDYNHMKKEKETIDEFWLTIDRLNYPYTKTLLEELETISNDIHGALKEFDLNRLPHKAVRKK